MKYVHVKLEVVAQVTDEQASVLCDPANADDVAERLFHELWHGDATLSAARVRGTRHGVAEADWSDG